MRTGVLTALYVAVTGWQLYAGWALLLTRKELYSTATVTNAFGAFVFVALAIAEDRYREAHIALAIVSALMALENYRRWRDSDDDDDDGPRRRRHDWLRQRLTLTERKVQGQES